MLPQAFGSDRDIIFTPYPNWSGQSYATHYPKVLVCNAASVYPSNDLLCKRTHYRT